MKVPRMWPVVLALALAQPVQASLSFLVVGDILVDQTTGYGWRQVPRIGFPATSAAGDGWLYATYDAITDMLPGPGSYAASSAAAAPFSFFDRGIGDAGGWYAHGTNSRGLPVFDGASYNYSVNNGVIVVQGWGVSTIGDYSATQCTPPYLAPPFEQFCNSPRAFFQVNPGFLSAVPTPSAWIVLLSGLLLFIWISRRSVSLLTKDRTANSRTMY